MKRWLRIVATLVVTSAALAYILTQIHVVKTWHILENASVPWVVLSAVLTLVTVPPMGWRWQLLLRARGVKESVGWLTRAYFVSYAVGQVLPTSVGGDASRIYETSRRHPGQITPITGSVLLERALGLAVTLVLAGAALLIAIGRYPIGAYLWVVAIFVVGTVAVGFVFFSRRVRTRLRFALPYVRRFRLEKAARAVYDGLHGYRDHPATLFQVAAISAAAQMTRIVAIYASGRSVGIHLSLLPYIVLGPLLFLVILVPFTVNGIGVREAFFVSFLGHLSVTHDRAFACGFLFFVMTILLALPGVAVVVWEYVLGRRATLVPDG
ncbi:MAG TPA: lysylphosphatidylglycerol synthase transmembrane domain-containing protein [Casimicrobiaceae bacterium]|nr:lysylphosphatidylglycerol synthase transmembrane domain-containing protein [Casimicrobiaceae bacterium]